MHRTRIILPPLLGLVLAGCVSWGWFAPGDFFALYGLPEAPARERAVMCHGYGCQHRTPVDLGPVWGEVAALFAAPLTPAGERGAMARAVALAETAAGPVLGTADDPGGVLNAAWSGNPAYQDCVDEAANTTTLLVLIEDAGLLRHHAVKAPSIRGMFLDGRWQHYAAVVAQRADGARFVVDSWFRDNGRPAVVMDFDSWYRGYGTPAEAG